MTDIQDPLPEFSFKFRRIFTYALTVLHIVMLAVLVSMLPANDVASFAWWLLVVHWFVITFYMVAPSAEQVVKIIQTARILRGKQEGGE